MFAPTVAMSFSVGEKGPLSLACGQTAPPQGGSLVPRGDGGLQGATTRRAVKPGQERRAAGGKRREGGGPGSSRPTQIADLFQRADDIRPYNQKECG